MFCQKYCFQAFDKRVKKRYFKKITVEKSKPHTAHAPTHAAPAPRKSVRAESTVVPKQAAMQGSAK